MDLNETKGLSPKIVNVNALFWQHANARKNISRMIVDSHVSDLFQSL